MPMADDIDRAADLAQFTRDLALSGVAAAALALAQPSGARYCQTCREPIDPRRLQVIPAARHCTDHATEGRP